MASHRSKVTSSGSCRSQFSRSHRSDCRARARYQLPESYILFVGTIEPRKNLLRLLHAWEPLYLAGEAPSLVIVGKRGWLAEDFYAALEVSPAREGVRFTGYVADEDLPALYSGASLFAFPSLYEGFGLPPLEAMACGAPVLCSNTSSLPKWLARGTDLEPNRCGTPSGGLAAPVRRLTAR
jgi:glycosyltransferase involved in cell wall biosynthesis